MSAFSFKIKNIILNCLILCVVISISFFSIYQISSLKKEFEHTKLIMDKRDTINQLISMNLQVGQAIRNVFIDINDSKAQANWKKSFDIVKDQMLRLKTLDPLLYAALEDKYLLFIENTDRLWAKVQQNTPLERVDIVDNTQFWRAYKDILLLQRAQLEKNTNFLIEEYEAQTNKAVSLIAILAIAVVFLTILFSTIFSRNIISSLGKIQAGLNSFFSYLNREVKHIEYIQIDGNDEFAQMAKAIDTHVKKIHGELLLDAQTVKNAVEIANYVKSGTLSERITAATANPELLELRDVLNTMLDGLEQNVTSVLQTIRSYSANDFRARTKTSDLGGEMADLVDGVNNLGAEMSKMLLEASINGETLQRSFSRLANSVGAMNECATKQAARLESTASSIEEIAGNIQFTAQKAADMFDIATQTKNSADNGLQLAKDTNYSMDEIYKAANAISDAVASIDRIAFQTNILSLNAAVEAASAGEAGKGFAVVAQEVRNLAARSADAAKQIKSIVEETKLKSKNGIEIAEQMSDGFKSLAEQIEQTRDLVEYVSNAASEQMMGIRHINDSMTQLDQMTQNNVNIANTLSTVSEEVYQTANKLVENSKNKKFDGR